uniref:Reverse transcriptase domain-containing protein n=1 Tax=Tanacetum cinerariifolium TaxID=118510 RepID=A0A699IAH6_TANCI|nr:hypothetical protein [Tanacetum cinerariifolium]
MQKVLMKRLQGVFLSNTVPNLQEDLKVITTRSGVTLARPLVPPPPLSSSKEVKQESERTTDQVLTKSTISVPPLVVQPFPASTSSELPHAPVSSPVVPEQNLHQPPIPYPLSFAEALAHMPKFAKMVKDLLTNKKKLLELANNPLNENCSAVDLKKLPKNLKTLGVDYDVDPRVPLILGRPFLRTTHAIFDVHGKELTLRDDDEKLVFNVEMEIDIFLASDDSMSPLIDDGAFDMEGDIRLIETLLNNDISNDFPLPIHVFEINETEKIKNLIDDPPDLKLKDLPPYLDYAFFRGNFQVTRHNR